MANHAPQTTSRPDGHPLEAVIAAAGVYVQPTSDLRPRVLQAAREHSQRRRSQRRLLAIAGGITAILVLATSAWMTMGANAGRAMTPMAATDLHHRALAVSSRTGVDPAWGLYEVVVELRREQATRINASCNRDVRQATR